MSQFSSTTRNLVPRFKRWSKGGRFGYEILTDLLILGCLLEEVDRFHLCLQLSASEHRDEVSVLSIGTPPYLRKNKGGIPGEQTSARLTIWLITSGKVAESNSRTGTQENIESK